MNYRGLAGNPMWRFARKAAAAGALAVAVLCVGWLHGDVTPVHAQQVVITKTVGVTPGGCPTTQAITATVGTPVYLCFTIQNTSAISYTQYVYRDTFLSQIFTSTTQGGGFPPGYILVRTSTELSSLGPLRMLESVTNSVLLTATAANGVIATAQSSARVNVVAPTPVDAAVLITKTVGTVPHVCADSNTVTINRGEPVYFCFTITNVGNVPFKEYRYADLYLLQAYTTPGEFWPGSVITLTDTAFASLGPVTPTASVTNTVSLEASGSYGSAEDFDRAHVTVIQPPPEPSILVTKTVGLVSGVCATEGTIQVSPRTPVFFCISIRNTGNTDFTQVQMRDEMQTTPPFAVQITQQRRLEPGQMITYTNARPELGFLGNVVQSKPFTNQVDVTVTGPNSQASGGSTASVEMPVGDRVYLPTVER